MIAGADQKTRKARPSVVLIADDLTGAADSGVTFTQHGAEVIVLWDPAQLGRRGDAFSQADVLAISTESRHGSAEEAERRVVAFMKGLSEVWRRPHRPWIYKKIDSTLRGHPGVELATVLHCLGTACPLEDEEAGSERGRPRFGALVAPAFPAQGRVTREGCHYVHGTPLAETVFGQEVPTSRVRDRFLDAFEPNRLVEISLSDVQLGLSDTDRPVADGRVLIADAERDADLGLLVRRSQVLDIPVLCGSAGLANALAEALSWRGIWRSSVEAERDLRPACAAVLVVAASRHPQTRRQIDLLRATGVPVLTPPADWFTDGRSHSTPVAASLAEALESGVVVLTTAGLPRLSLPGSAIVSRLAEAVATQIKSAAFEGPSTVGGTNAGGRGGLGLVLTGGDAAIAVSHALGVQALQLAGEVASGMPWGILKGGIGEGLPVVTKAGGFGDDAALASAVTYLRGEAVD